MAACAVAEREQGFYPGESPSGPNIDELQARLQARAVAAATESAESKASAVAEAEAAAVARQLLRREAWQAAEDDWCGGMLMSWDAGTRHY